MSGIFSRSEQVNWASDDTILIRTQRRYNGQVMQKECKPLAAEGERNACQI